MRFLCLTQSLKRYSSKPLFMIMLLGFSSGLPLALTGATLTAWLFEAGVDFSVIGLFAAVGTPYTLKFLWSPLIDGLRVPVLVRFGQRRSWLLVTQGLVVLALLALGSTNPALYPKLTAYAALLVAFASASQDIVYDAYRVELMKPEEQGYGVAMAQLGYRIGMVVSGAGGLVLAEKLGWHSTYYTMAMLMGAGMAVVLWADEPAAAPRLSVARQPFSAWLSEHVVNPFADFMRSDHWWLILLFIIMFRLADAFMGAMTNPFLLAIGFSKSQIAEIVKLYGVVATLVGIFLGGWLVERYGAIRIMFVAGGLHALTNLLYVVQAYVGANQAVLAGSIIVENLTGGISGAGFVAYLGGLCHVHYTATQYALLSSLSGVSRVWLSTPAGWVSKHLGWEGFFTFSALLALPGLLLLRVLNQRIRRAS